MRNKMLKISVSQIKTFCCSRSKRVGMYCLGIKDTKFSEDSLALGCLFENRLLTGQDDYTLLEGRQIDNMEKLIQDYDNLKYNAECISVHKGNTQLKVEASLLGVYFTGYIDNFTPDMVIEEIKTCHYLTKINDINKNHRSGMSTYEEYKLQIWVYMRLMRITKARIIEVAKHVYKDGRRASQVLEFSLTKEFDKEMEDKYKPIIEEMTYLYKTYKTGY